MQISSHSSLNLENLTQYIQSISNPLKDMDYFIENANSLTFIDKNDEKYNDLIKKDYYTNDQQYRKVKDLLTKLVNDNKANNSFSLKTLSDKLFKDESIEHVVENTFLLSKAIVEYGNYNPETGELDDELIYLGDPKLDICTTKQKLQNELKLIELIADKRTGFNVKLDKNLVDSVLQKNSWMSSEQIDVVKACCLTNSPYSVSIGYAGAGKTTTITAIVDAYKQAGFKAQGVVLSWKAASVLKNEAKMSCFSLESFLSKSKMRLMMGLPIFDEPQIILLDEAGLVGLNKMKEFLELINKSDYPVKVIFSGDPTQLNPILEPNALELVEMVTSKDAKATISEIRRQYSASHRQAVLSFRDGYAGEGLYVYHQQEAISLSENEEELENKILNDYFAAKKFNPDETSLIIGLDHKMVKRLNNKIREGLIKLGKIDVDSQIEVPVQDSSRNDIYGNPLPITKQFAIGDQIVFTKNEHKILLKDKKTHKEYDAFLMNKTTGRISAISGNNKDGYDLTVDIMYQGEDVDDKDEVMAYVKINTKNYAQNNLCSIDLNYAITGYSSQGQTVQRVFCIDSNKMNMRYAYVCASRHRLAMSIYLNKQEIFDDMVKRKLKNKDSDKKDLSTIECIEYVAQRWGRENKQESALIKFFNTLKELKEMEMKYKVKLDVNNLPDNFNFYKMKYEGEKRKLKQNKARYQPFKKNIPLLDSIDYYMPIPDKIDFESINQEQVEFNPTLSNFDAPIKLKDTYNLSNIINEDVFNHLKGKYLDIGKGGEIRFISKLGDFVISKYDIFGNDVLKQGFPFMFNGGGISNPKDTTSSQDIYICKDLNQTLEYMKHFYLDNPSLRYSPTIIWGNKDTNFDYILQAIENKNIYIIGDDNYKKNIFLSLVKNDKNYQLNATFMNFDRKSLQDLINKEEITPNNISRVAIKHKDFIEKSGINNNDESYNLNKSILNNEYKKNEICDEEGILKEDLIKKYIFGENIIDEKRYNEMISPQKTRALEIKENLLKIKEPEILQAIVEVRPENEINNVPNVKKMKY